MEPEVSFVCNTTLKMLTYATYKEYFILWAETWTIAEKNKQKSAWCRSQLKWIFWGDLRTVSTPKKPRHHRRDGDKGHTPSHHRWGSLKTKFLEFWRRQLTSWYAQCTQQTVKKTSQKYYEMAAMVRTMTHSTVMKVINPVGVWFFVNYLTQEDRTS